MNLDNRARHRGAALLMLMMILGVVGAFFTMRIFGSGKQQVEKERATILALVHARDALLGFAAANDRLPCPAAPGATGIESPAGGACTNFYNGFLPAITLGLPGVDSNGYLLDGWGGRVRYAVTRVGGTNAATTFNALTSNNFNPLVGPLPDLRVCASATGITATTCGTAQALTTDSAAVIFSLGANGMSGVIGGFDEAANQNAPADQVFVSHPATDSGAPNGEFDDLLIWLPRNTLEDRMTQAGKLP